MNNLQITCKIGLDDVGTIELSGWFSHSNHVLFC
jgi:hypothetical protein